jgi:hypothetical protein
MANQDLREQLVNECQSGTFAQAQLAAERITSLHGILFDLDPGRYRPGNPILPPDPDPKTFFTNIEAVLDRHPLARSAEVRVTGTGLHVIVRLCPAVELTSSAEQEHWEHIVRAVQATLPADVNAPGITALTRPVGSVNSKNGRTVEVIRPGTTVSAEQVTAFLTRVARAPFKEVISVLLGGLRVTPCPVCRGEGTRLDVLNYVGMCYGHCGKLKLAQVFDSIYVPFTKDGAANKAGAKTVKGTASGSAKSEKRPGKGVARKAKPNARTARTAAQQP